VDGTNYPPEITDILPQIVNAVVMAEHGRTVFPGAQLVHHGVDAAHFWPVEERAIQYGSQLLRTKADCKRALGFDPDKRLILRVDKNSGRKDYAATIKAVAPLLERDRSLQLHLHASTDPKAPGCNIPVMLTRYDLEPDQVRLADLDGSVLGWGQSVLNILYNAADVFVTTSRGEGFGLTIAEALSVGVPVIAQSVSAIPEVVGTGGFLIAPRDTITVPAGHDLWLPDIEAFRDRLRTVLYDLSEADRRALGEAGRKHVSQFRWEPAADRFHDFIEGFTAARRRASTEATRGS
jgi:glycosyltransferase involved in cell wall biosynthesis